MSCSLIERIYTIFNMDNHLFGLLCLVFLEVVDVLSDCPIEITPPILKVKYGDDARANCRALVPAHYITWRMFNGDDDRGPSTTSQSLELDIHKVDWSLRAHCTIVPKEGEECSKDLPVVVYQMPVKVELTGPSSPVVEGRPYKFVCTVKEATTQPNLTVRWFKGDELAGEEMLDTSDKLPQEWIPTWDIFTFSLEDDGKMCYCEAGLDVESEHPVRSNSLAITVHYCPIEITPPILKVKYGDDARANCRALVPAHSITWRTLNGDADGPSTDSQSLDLDIYSVDWGFDAQCSIVTKEGERCDKDLPVVVYQMPVEVDLAGPSFPVVEGQSYKFICTVKKTTAQPNLTVRWFKGDKFAGEEIIRLSEKEPLELIETRTIFTFSREDDGKMCYCEAGLDVESEHPVRSNSLAITVHYPPAPMVDEYWLIGLDITLDCTATSNPPPTYTWTSKFRKGNLGTQPRIRVRGDDEYACTATNPLGSTTKTFAVSDPGTGTLMGMENIFTCKSHELIPIFRVCNGLKDCFDGSDEENCDHRTNCPVKITPPSLALRRGAHARASCDATVPVNSIGWASSYHTKSSPGVTSLEWSEEDGVDWDHRARCFIVPEEGDLCLKDLPIRIYQMPSLVEIAMSSQVAQEGKEHHLYCTLHNTTSLYMSVRWFRNGEWFAESSPAGLSEEPDTVTSNLTHIFRLWDDEKKISCEAALNIASEPPVRSDPLIIRVSYAECPIEISPSTLVVRYGDTAFASCQSLVAVHGMGWEASEGATGLVKDAMALNWTIENITYWKMEATCFINPKAGAQCSKDLPIVVYKMPVEVKITGPSTTMMAGHPYKFNCTIQDATPSPNLTVRWFKGDKLDGEEIVKNSSKLPVTLMESWTFTFSREDDGKMCYCEAGLDVESEHPVRSNLYAITVHYPPDTMEDVVLDLRSDTVLDCTATCNPPPTYTWTSTSTQEDLGTQPRITVTKAGNYTCTAANEIGSATKHFMVKSTSSGTFWAILGVGIGVAVVLIAGYGLYRLRADPNSII